MIRGLNHLMRRRQFLRKIGVALASVLTAGLTPRLMKKGKNNMIEEKEARFYERRNANAVQCLLCFRNCMIEDGRRGFCRNRENRNGRLLALTHSRPCTVMVDPIEKEPAYHMLPGTDILCTATAGCNSRCKHCQNWEISQATVESLHNLAYSPAQIVSLAVEHSCPTLSFTYSDPIAFHEYMFDISSLGKEKGLLTLCHTNGTMQPDPLKELLKVLDGVTVDLKGFTDDFYGDICSMKLQPVLRSLELIRKSGRHLEIVNLVIPTWNDNPKDIRRMCRWIAKTLGRDVPLHLNRFHPAYKLQNIQPTPRETLENAYSIAREEGLEYVYIGNMPGHKLNSTFCPKCGSLLIQRVHFFSTTDKLKDGRCRDCGLELPGIWKI